MERFQVRDHIRTLIDVWTASKRPDLSEAQTKAAAAAASALSDTENATLTAEQLRVLLEANKTLNSKQR